MVQVSELYLYPVKSLRGFQLQQAVLTNQGLAFDRFWMVIDENNRFITQRKLAAMVLIHTTLSEGQLILSKPSDSDLGSLIINAHQAPDSDPFTATVWKDECLVIDEGDEASQWITQAIGSTQTLRLVRMAEQPRSQSKPELLGAHTSTLFADAAPFLVANTASLTAVNNNLQQHSYDSVTMEHFRPNIVITGIDAFVEHQINTLTHDHYELSHCYPCQRCIIPTINPDTAEKHPKQQPFSLISDINAMPNNPKAPAFGENAILVHGEGHSISIGDTLTIN